MIRLNDKLLQNSQYSNSIQTVFGTLVISACRHFDIFERFRMLWISHFRYQMLKFKIIIFKYIRIIKYRTLSL